MFIFLHGTWKDNIRSVILDWRLVGQAKGRDLLVSQVKGETRWSLKQTCQLPCVCSPAIALLHKKGPCHRRKICANSFWLYSYFTQTLSLKNKNINHIFIYLRVLRCLSSSPIYNIVWRKRLLEPSQYTLPHHPLRKYWSSEFAHFCR